MAATRSTRSATTAARTARTAKASTQAAPQPEAAPTADIAALLANPTVLAALAALAGNSAPAETPEIADDDDDSNGVDPTQGYTPPPGQPVLTDPNGAASRKVKRLWADLRLREIEKPTKQQTDALAAYDKALHMLMLAVGIKGAATVTAADAQWAVHDLNAAAQQRKVDAKARKRIGGCAPSASAFRLSARTRKPATRKGRHVSWVLSTPSGDRGIVAPPSFFPRQDGT
jgi:hypothetical protein